MADKFQPKLAEALKDQQPKVDGVDGRSVHPEQASERFNPAEARQHNREVSAGLHSNKDRLVGVGRGNQAAGRQKGK